MEFKGTKSKWELGNYHKTIVYSLDKIKDINLFELNVYSNNKLSTQKELEANALLISKAPEMLEMLNYISKYLKELEKTNNLNFISRDIVLKKIQQLTKEATEL